MFLSTEVAMGDALFIWKDCDLVDAFGFSSKILEVEYLIIMFRCKLLSLHLYVGYSHLYFVFD